jgi:hypothetical protein|nr:MAG TPA: hypothetical protein [Caudoviricetes sp.]
MVKDHNNTKVVPSTTSRKAKASWIKPTKKKEKKMARQMDYYVVLGEVGSLIRADKFLLNKVNKLVEKMEVNPKWDVIGCIAYEVCFNFGYKNPTKTQIKKSILKAIHNIIAIDMEMQYYKEVSEEELHDAVYEEFPF